MSDLASLLARQLIQQSSGGISDEQVGNFLNLYDQQVPDSIKRDPEARDKLLETSKRIARSIDDYDMPRVTVTVQDFCFNPPSIESELPCQLQFRVLPHSSRQQISVLNSSKKAVSTSGILHGGDTFTTTICDPGSYTFTSEVYPFMSGRLKAEVAAAVAPAAAPTEQEAPSASKAPGGTPGSVGKVVLPDQRQYLRQSGAGVLDTGAPSTAGVLLGQAGHSNVDTPAGENIADAPTLSGSKRVSDASDGLCPQPSEHAVLELVSAAPAAASRQSSAQHGPLSAAAAIASISTMPDLSRAGRWARRATAYDDELDQAPNSSSETHRGVNDPQPSRTCTALATADSASCAAHFSVQLCGSSDSTGMAAATAAAAAATSAAHADAAVCGVAISASGLSSSAGSMGRSSALDDEAAPQDMDIDDASCPEQNVEQQAVEILPLMQFAKGLEGLTSSPEPVKATAGGSSATLCADSSHAGAAADQNIPDISALQGDSAVQLGSEASGEYQEDPAAWYERLRSDSDHSSVSSDREQPIHARDNAPDSDMEQECAAGSCRGAAGGERTRLLSCQVEQRLSHSSRHMRRFAAWGDDSGPDDDSSDDAAGDVRLRTVHGCSAIRSRPQMQQQQQCPSREEDDSVLVMEEYEDGDDPAMSTAAALAVQRMAADAAREAAWQQRPQHPLSSRAQDTCSTTARGALETILPEPPGSKWNLGGTAYHAAGVGLKSTFSSTEQACTDCASGSSSPAAAIGSESKCTSYFERLTSSSSSRTHIALDASGQAVNSGGGSTMLGPGTHVIGRQTLRHRSTTTSVSADDPIAQYTRLQQLRKAEELRNKQHLLQLAEQDGSDSGAEDVPPLRARLEQQRYAAAAAAEATQASMEQNKAPAGKAISSAASQKKKKGRGKGFEADQVTAADANTAVAAVSRAAAEAKRRERDHLECALWDRGGSSRGDSEDETSSKPRPGVSAPLSVSGRSAEALKQLSKCKFKTCKLTFSAMLNKHRCHMSHLPSARNATTKSYKAEVVNFLQALPPAALAQLLRLPEPASLPKHSRLDLVQAQQQGKASRTGSSSSSASSAAATAKTSSEAEATAVAIRRLQSSKLSDAWLNASLSAAADAEGSAVFRPTGQQQLMREQLQLSALAQLCCGTDIEDEKRTGLLGSGASTSAAKRQDCEPQDRLVTSAAAALAAAHVAGIRGPCCSSCKASCTQGVLAATHSMQCSCRCHSTSSESAQQQAAQLPGLDYILSLLEQASEGTWLCNPRLLQQPHPSGCCCSVCLGLVACAGASAAWSPEAVMASISSGIDVLDVLGEWGVDDAGLSYAVERRLVTAFHKAKDAEAARIMSQLLEEDSPAAGGSSRTGSSTMECRGSGQQQAATTAAASQGSASSKAAGRKKDKKRTGKAAKSSSSGAPAKKIPAWKAVSSDSASSDSSDELQPDVAPAAPVDPEAAGASPGSSLAGLVGPAGRMPGSRSSVFAARPGSPKQVVFDSPSKGRQLAEQLLQARLVQQDQELNQLRKLKQQAEQQAKQQAKQQEATSLQCQTRETQSATMQQQQQAAKQQAVKHQQLLPEQGKAASMPGVKQQLQIWQKLPQPPAGSRLETSARQAALPDVRVVNRVSLGGKRVPQQQQLQQQPPPPPPSKPYLLQEKANRQRSKQSLINAGGESAAASRSSSSGSSASGSSLKGYAAAAAVIGGASKAANSARCEPQKAAATTAVEQSASATDLSVKQVAAAVAAEEPRLTAATAATPTVTQKLANFTAGVSAPLTHAANKQPVVAAPSAATDTCSDAPAAVEHSNSVHVSCSSPEAATASEVALAAWPTGPCEAPAEGDQQPSAGMQPHQQLQWPQQQHYQQPHAALLHQHWFAAAHQQAIQDMLMYSGRAAAVAAGQELPPFTPQEQQCIAHWTQFYYYQQAYLGLAATTQQLQLGDPPSSLQAGHSASQPMPAAAGSWEQQQQQLSQQQDRPMQQEPEAQQGTENMHQGQQNGQQEHQQHLPEPPALQLQFGSFPAEFTFAAEEVSPRGFRGPAASATASPEAEPLLGDKAAAENAADAVNARGVAVAPGDQGHCTQVRGAPPGANEQCMYWWAYQQQCAQLAYLQQQKDLHAQPQLHGQSAAAATAASAPMQPTQSQQQQQQQQQQPVRAPPVKAVCNEPAANSMYASSSPTGSASTVAEQLQAGAKPASSSEQPKFLDQLAAAMGSTVAASAADASSNSSRESGSRKQRGSWPAPSFNAVIAAQLLDSRWETVTQTYGYPKRCIAVHVFAAAEGTAAAAAEQQQGSDQQSTTRKTAAPTAAEVSMAPAMAPASKGACDHAPHHRCNLQHSKPHTSRGGGGGGSTASAAGSSDQSKPSGAGVWRVKRHR